MEQLAHPLDVELGKLGAREGMDLSGSHNNQLQGAGLGAGPCDVVSTLPLSVCAPLGFWASCPELLVAHELFL